MSFELMPEFSSRNIVNYNLINEIMETNEKSEEYGFALLEKDAEMIVKVGKEAMTVHDRIEIGKSVTVKIIEKFIQSTYISPREYAETIAKLIEIFYEVKEESLDFLDDDEVIEIMFNFFETQSMGSLELLQSRDMDYLCQQIRKTAYGILEDEQKKEEFFDEWNKWANSFYRVQYW